MKFTAFFNFKRKNLGIMKVIVTGAAGYIGSHTVLELLEAGHDVLSVDNFANAIQCKLSHLS